MKIQYFGTAAAEGWPAVFCGCEACRRARSLGGHNIRTRAQAMINDELLVDLPPDTYYHALKYGVDLSAVETLLITHSHQDHFYPFELFLRGFPYAHEPAAPVLTVYGNKKVRELYMENLKLCDSPNIEEHLRFCDAVPFETFDTAEGYQVTPLLASHAKNEECLIYLIEKDGKRIFYANDSGFYPPETWQFLAGKHLDLVSFDCTNVCTPDGKYHMGLPDNIEAKEHLIELGCADENTQFVVTHFSHNGKLTHDEIVSEAQKNSFIAAYDGIIIEL